MSNNDDIQRCYSCDHPLPKLMQLNSVHMLRVKPPNPGDVSICAACGAFGVFDGSLQIQPPSMEQMTAIYNTPELLQMQYSILTRPGM